MTSCPLKRPYTRFFARTVASVRCAALISTQNSSHRRKIHLKLSEINQSSTDNVPQICVCHLSVVSSELTVPTGDRVSIIIHLPKYHPDNINQCFMHQKLELIETKGKECFRLRWPSSKHRFIYLLRYLYSDSET